jgi:hypothetical protein
MRYTTIVLISSATSNAIWSFSRKFFYTVIYGVKSTSEARKVVLSRRTVCIFRVWEVMLSSAGLLVRRSHGESSITYHPSREGRRNEDRVRITIHNGDPEGTEERKHRKN